MSAVQRPDDYYRFCPGEEHIKLSNAICRGRRNSHFPKCHGCQFNDDEKRNRQAAAEQADSAEARMGLVFQPFDICGKTPAPLTEEAAWRIGHATAQYLHAKLRGFDRADPHARSLVVARDARPHSKRLQAALVQGVQATGMDVIDVGLADTPRLYFAVGRLRTCGGVMTTGGHLPAEYNGFKICGGGASPMSVETGLASIRDLAIRVPRHETRTTARTHRQDVSRQYAEFVRGFLFVGLRLARPLRIVVDASNGMAARSLPIILKGVQNLDIMWINDALDGSFAHTPEPLDSRNRRALRRAVKSHEAHFGICFDGDGCRCMVLDEKGMAVRPDLLMTLIARMLLERAPGETIIHDLRASDVLSDEIDRAGGVAARERVGHPFIKKTMNDRNALFGGDFEGRFYYRDNWFCESGLITFIHVVNLLVASGRHLSELTRPLHKYRHSGELTFEVRDAEQVFRQVQTTYADGQAEDLDGLTIRYPDWWFNLRRLSGEPRIGLTVEARSKKLIDEKLAALRPMLQA